MQRTVGTASYKSRLFRSLQKVYFLVRELKPFAQISHFAVRGKRCVRERGVLSRMFRVACYRIVYAATAQQQLNLQNVTRRSNQQARPYL